MSISIFSYRKFGIQRILNVGSGIENLFPEEFLYSNIEILDVPEFNIIPGMYVNEGGKATRTRFTSNPQMTSQNGICGIHLLLCRPTLTGFAFR